jgi:hypothetical protein
VIGNDGSLTELSAQIHALHKALLSQSPSKQA